MIKILFICYGNICRSPMAEFVMKKMVRDSGCEADFHIASAATSTEEILNGRGSPVYPPARAELARHGIDCGGKRAVQVTSADYAQYDRLICMETRNVRDLLRLLGGDPRKKVSKLLDYTGTGGDIADPWYSGQFRETYRDIEAGCAALLRQLRKEEHSL